MGLKCASLGCLQVVNCCHSVLVSLSILLRRQELCTIPVSNRNIRVPLTSYQAFQFFDLLALSQQTSDQRQPMKALPMQEIHPFQATTTSNKRPEVLHLP